MTSDPSTLLLFCSIIIRAGAHSFCTGACRDTNNNTIKDWRRFANLTFYIIMVVVVVVVVAASMTVTAMYYA